MDNPSWNASSGLFDLVSDIYDCAIDPAKWPAALERITKLVDGREAAIAFHNFSRPDFSLSTKWNTNPAFERAMQDHIAISPLIPMAWYAEVDKPFSAFRFIGEDELKKGRWHKETVGAFGYGDTALGLLIRSTSHFAGLSILRMADQPLFDDNELEPLRLLCPHIRRAVMIADLLDARALERDTLANALDLLMVAVVLTDATARIVHANEAARRHFEDGRAIRREGDQLGARAPECAAELSEAIANAASGGMIDFPKSGIAVCVTAAGGRDLAAWVLPLDGGLRRDLGATFAARVAVFIRELGDTSPFPAELFVRRYGITPAECRVLMLLTQGMTPKEAAETLGVSLATAKTHISRLFEKTGTQRQADLIRLAMSALAPARR